MTRLDLTLPSPAENLALDEALLDTAESGGGPEVLRLWESPTPFVVVGYANNVASEVNVAACESRGSPILRRCSGGGTVVQGPGCLNYAVVLRITETGPTRSISSTNRYVMERNQCAIAAALQISPAAVAIQGHTDLVLGNLKFSGNAQRRKKNFLLFHGTFLLNFNLALIGELLKPPSLQPEYRANRPHAKFIMNLNLESRKVSESLTAAWNAIPDLRLRPTPASELVAKYQSARWNFQR